MNVSLRVLSKVDFNGVEKSPKARREESRRVATSNSAEMQVTVGQQQKLPVPLVPVGVLPGNLRDIEETAHASLGVAELLRNRRDRPHPFTVALNGRIRCKPPLIAQQTMTTSKE